MKNLCLVAAALVFLSACSMDIKYREPIDQWQLSCNAGKLVNTPLSCPATHSLALPNQGGRALVLLIEPVEFAYGNPIYDAFTGNGGLPEGVQPIMRKLMFNFYYAYFKQLMTFRTQYKRIYLVKSDGPLSSVFLSTLKKAGELHESFDVFLIAHGDLSRLVIDKYGNSPLYADDLYNYLRSDVPEGKLRAVFNTACHSGESLPGKRSITDAFAKGSTQAVVYGHLGMNNAPIHKDLVAFSQYYKFNNYLNSINTAKDTVLTTKQASSDLDKISVVQQCDPTTGKSYESCRTMWLPTITVRGCFGSVKCKDQSFGNTGQMFSKSDIASSLPALKLSEFGNINMAIDNQDPLVVSKKPTHKCKADTCKCDLNMDGEVNIPDITSIGINYKKKETEKCKHPKNSSLISCAFYDPDGDGVVTARDIEEISAHIYAKCSK